MSQPDEKHLLPVEALPFARAFLRGISIPIAQDEVISGHEVSYGKTYIEAHPDYINDQERHQAKIDGIMQILQELDLKPATGEEIVVIGCGHGTHDEFLARNYGLKVSGVDISEEALDIARKKAIRADLPIQYIYADATLGLPFTLNTKRAAFCVGTSWGMDPQDERNQATFAHIFSILQPEGVFVLDYVNGQKWRAIEGERHKEIIELSHGMRRIVEGEYYPDQTTQITKIILERPGQRPQFYYEHVKYYQLAEVLAMLKAVGFSIQKVYGDVEEHPFNPLTSDQMVVIATKQ